MGDQTLGHGTTLNEAGKAEAPTISDMLVTEPPAGTLLTTGERAMNRLPYVELYEDVASNWRYRIVGANGEIVAASEPYASKSNAKRGFNDLVRIVNEVATTDE